MNKFAELYPNAVIELSGEYHPFYHPNNSVEINIDDDFITNCYYNQDPDNSIPTVASLKIALKARYYGLDYIELHKTGTGYKVECSHNSDIEEDELEAMVELQNMLDNGHVTSVNVDGSTVEVDLIVTGVVIKKGEYLTPGHDGELEYDTMVSTNYVGGDLGDTIVACEEVMEDDDFEEVYEKSLADKANVAILSYVEATEFVSDSELMVWMLNNIDEIIAQYSGCGLLAVGIDASSNIINVAKHYGFYNERETGYQFKLLVD